MGSIDPIEVYLDLHMIMMQLKAIDSMRGATPVSFGSTILHKNPRDVLISPDFNIIVSSLTPLTAIILHLILSLSLIASDRVAHKKFPYHNS